MIVSEEILNELYDSISEEKLSKANSFADTEKVIIKKVLYDDTQNFIIKAKVIGLTDIYETNITVANGEIENVKCECLDYKKNYGTCKHIAATLIAFSKNIEYIKLFDKDKKLDASIYENEEINNIGKQKEALFRDNRESYKVFNQMIKKFYKEEKNNVVGEELKKAVNILPILRYSSYRGLLEIEFKIGITQYYKIRDLVDFYNRIKGNEYYKYGTKLEFIHTKDAFVEESKDVLNFILKYAEIFEYLQSSLNYYEPRKNNSIIRLNKTRMDEAFELFKGQNIQCINEERNNGFDSLEFIDENPNIEFNIKEVNKFEYNISPNLSSLYEYRIIEGEKNFYFLDGLGKIYRCSKEFENTTLRLLRTFRENFTKEVVFKKEDFPNFLSVVFPKVKKSINMKELKKDEVEKYIPHDLCVKMYLDYDDKNRIVSKVLFCYGEKEYNPFAMEKANIVKNIAQENDVLNTFMATGFMKDYQNERIILIDEEKIYNFLSKEIEEYMKKFEVLATDTFKEKEIKEPRMTTIGVKINNNLLNIDFSNLNFDREELVQIMEKYSLKKKYHRLKNGKFIQLTQNDTMDFIENIATGLDLSFKQIEKGELNLPVYRSMYLEKLLNNMKTTQITKSVKYKDMVEKISSRDLEENFTIPKSIDADLRNYQKVGYKWLKILDIYKMGGILADDMGLGKTLQMILVITSYVETENNPKSSIVICPSSLTLNWENEIKRFSKKLKVLVINGTGDERRNKIDKINNYDVVITSYDSLKRDIEIFEEKNIDFKYIIADEAQYIKNSNTQNSKAVKKLTAETRFALTGTPIENSLSELWSIFDFIMPGYLFGYKKFRNLYEIPIMKDNDEKAMNKLKMLIEPFVLRRVKKEVLTELPDKTITILNNEMEEEQLKIYASYMQKAKKEALEEISNKGIEKSQIKILALLTRLRQLCCHPSLFIENYEGESSKLIQCVEIIKDAIESHHKILLFSGYTSMFSIIEKELEKEQIKFFKLTGQTKVSQRIGLVDEFNTNPDVKVFLISLKAGGTGLNLTGADMVIHYDPWWNLSAENQATDRTYRIGQKRNVQVYKLITKNSIEEKIFDLQKKKEKLIDNMLSTGETFINKLSKEDIMQLFD